MKSGLERWFSGRLNRRGYSAGFFPLSMGGHVVVMLVLSELPVERSSIAWGLACGVIVTCLISGIVLGGVSLCIRRFHDLGLSGWFTVLLYVLYGSIFLLYIPPVQLLFVLLLAFWPGESGSNRYGPPPKSGWNPLPPHRA
jgi:uncharacterized membrane protein YhaH (DUF805 family)